LSVKGEEFFEAVKETVKPYVRFLKKERFLELPNTETITVITENMFAVNLFPDLLRDFGDYVSQEEGPTIHFDVREARSFTEAMNEFHDPAVLMLLWSQRPGKKFATPDNVRASKPLIVFDDVALIPKKAERFRKLRADKGVLQLDRVNLEPLCFIEPTDVAVERRKASRSNRHISVQSLAALREMTVRNEIIGVSIDWMKVLGTDCEDLWELRQLNTDRKPSEVRIYERVKPALGEWAKKFRKRLVAAVQQMKMYSFDEKRPGVGG
jgi:hypothetical protein